MLNILVTIFASIVVGASGSGWFWARQLLKARAKHSVDLHRRLELEKTYNVYMKTIQKTDAVMRKQFAEVVEECRVTTKRLFRIQEAAAFEKCDPDRLVRLAEVQEHLLGRERATLSDYLIKMAETDIAHVKAAAGVVRIAQKRSAG